MVEYGLKGIRCGSCVSKITDALLEARYNNVFVTLDSPSLRLEADTSISRDELQEKLTQVGDYKIATDDDSSLSYLNKQTIYELLPLFIVIGYITFGTLLRSSISSDYSFHTLMSNFMGGFFVVFSLFKFLNLKDFADTYATYDVIAKRFRIYAFSYPFIELLLGVLYFLGFYSIITNLITLTLMAIGSIGVFNAIKSKQTFQCACLGAALKLPITKVTLIENVSMGLMALFMAIMNFLAS